MLRLESPAVDGKSCASVCTRYRTDYRFRYRGVATRILQSARHDRSGRVRERKGAREAPRGLKPKPGPLGRYGVKASSVRALPARHFFVPGRRTSYDKQTNNAAKERGGSGLSRPVTSEAMRAAREDTSPTD